MNPRLRAILRALILVGVVIALFLIFPGALKFAEMGARELRYFWWLILLVALACWLIWGFKRRP
jgi:hypothetical protein